MTDVQLFAGVALAGLVSFASPCVLPLVPAYLAYLAGTALQAAEDPGGGPARRTVLARALALVLGFATVFILQGDQAAPIGKLLSRHKDTLAVGAGGLILLAGLHVLGATKLVLRKAGVGPSAVPGGAAPSLPAAFVLGATLFFGWTPCIGPVLSAILKVAADVASEGAGVRLLTAYMTGLGIGFLAIAAVIGPLLTLLTRHAHHQRLAILSGVILTVSGLLIATDQIGGFGTWLLETFPALGDLEEAVTGPGVRAAILKQGAP
jgi:cytochrome c-type biogenesis protein